MFATLKETYRSERREGGRGGGREGGTYLKGGRKAHLQVPPVLRDLGGQLLEDAEEGLLEHGLGGREGGREGRRGGRVNIYVWVQDNHPPAELPVIWPPHTSLPPLPPSLPPSLPPCVCVSLSVCGRTWEKVSARTMRPPVFSTHTFISIMPT